MRLSNEVTYLDRDKKITEKKTILPKFGGGLCVLYLTDESTFTVIRVMFHNNNIK